MRCKWKQGPSPALLRNAARGMLVVVLLLLPKEGCKRENEGELVIRWKVKKLAPVDPDPCATAGISQVVVGISRSGETEASPLVRTYACSQGMAEIDLDEGLYDITISKQQGAQTAAVTTLKEVEVVARSRRDWAGLYPPFPEDANDIELPFCGNGKRDGDEECDGSDMGGKTCADLDLPGDRPACTGECRLDAAACVGDLGPLTVTWIVLAPDGVTPSDCGSEGIDQVRYELLEAGSGEVISLGYAGCASGQVVLADVGFGAYSVLLTGLDEDLIPVASASATDHEHADSGGSQLNLGLVALP